MPTASISSMKTMHWPPHLAASRFAFRARYRTIRASTPMKVWANPEPGIVTNGELNPVAIAFASIVLPVPGAPWKRMPRSRRPPARSNASPDCPEADDPPHLLLRLRLAADVLELDSPVGVARLEAFDLRDAHHHHRAHQDQEVEEEEDRQDDELRPERRVREPRPRTRSQIDVGRAPPGDVAARRSTGRGRRS